MLNVTLRNRPKIGRLSLYQQRPAACKSRKEGIGLISVLADTLGCGIGISIRHKNVVSIINIWHVSCQFCGSGAEHVVAIFVLHSSLWDLFTVFCSHHVFEIPAFLLVSLLSVVFKFFLSNHISATCVARVKEICPRALQIVNAGAVEPKTNCNEMQWVGDTKAFMGQWWLSG